MDRFVTKGEKRTLQAEVKAAVEVPAKHRSRKYDEAYLQLGFTQSGSNDAPRPQCVVCGEVLANDSMRPCKLRRHLETKHPTLVSKSVEFFRGKLNELTGQKKVVEVYSTVNMKATEASYLVSLRIAKAGKPHNIGEKLLLPAAKDMCTVMIGEKAASQLDMVPLSNDTVSRRIADMAADVKEQLLEGVCQSPCFSIQIDESTDISDAAQLLVYIRYATTAKELKEEFLFCRPLPTRTTGEELFKLLNSFVQDTGLDWGRCFGICSDGARSMTGRHSGLVTRVQKVAPVAAWNHCMIHRQALAAKKMPQELSDVLSVAVKVVNFIKSQPLNSRIFTTLCEDMGANAKHLLLHAEVRWLSRGKVLTRLCELREEVRIFLADNNSPLVHYFSNTRWVSLLAYLADIFERLNSLNVSLQGRNANVFTAHDRIAAFMNKLELWSSRVKHGSVCMFPTLEDVMQQCGDLSFDSIQGIIVQHLGGLQEQFHEYFPEVGKDKGDQWIRNPFTFKPKPTDNLSSKEEESLIDLSSDKELQHRFSQIPIADFWLSLGCEFQHTALRLLSDQVGPVWQEMKGGGMSQRSWQPVIESCLQGDLAEGFQDGSNRDGVFLQATAHGSRKP
ncbi:zinc finger BED domain-containing protein 5-like [Latimeria chalumnae]|uniref:zinc finger BED domain-containing protein 5-like n=1 Tax=Latimeria chalumnae TaxID=7897 RepID=UPI00313C1100